ncbi:hypothetical protein BGZ97_009545 [Linnemannia gamsii]|jgi:hypothetical protein|uniref:Uncharacterized protein n=1 Tax=Linnemannia gamsii TaxID=64522 RepID=A0A9P6RC51_9FUNG|nr:hypothetical protein BGZ97_009545 [Linnemannia gamsii]
MNRTEAVIIDLTSGAVRRNSVVHQVDTASPATQPHYYEISMVQLQAPQGDSVASPDLFDEMEPYLKSRNNQSSQAHSVRAKL